MLQRRAVSPESFDACKIFAFKTSVPKSVLTWRRWFTFFFQNFWYLLFHTILINAIRGALPQNVDLMNSYASYKSSHGFFSFLWVFRDALMMLQVAVVLMSAFLRWLASLSPYVRNRTRMISSGKEILVSFCISIACSALFFSAGALLGTCVLAPVVTNDYDNTHRVFLSFFNVPGTSGFGKWDLILTLLHFALALGTVAEHLSRREVVNIGLLLQTGVGQNVLRLFIIKQYVSLVAMFTWVVLYYLRKTSHVVLALRILSSMFSLALIVLHACSAAASINFLYTIVKTTDKDLQITWGLGSGSQVISFLRQANIRLHWVRVHGQQNNVKRFLKQFIPLLLWHVSGRTLAAQVSMFVAFCNWPPIVPAKQIGLFTLIVTISTLSVFGFRLLYFMNPSCTNTSGNDIPTAHLGFGMLVLKFQLLSYSQGNRLKMVPATVERLMEAITISYRWDLSDSFPMLLWNRDEPQQFHTIKLNVLRKAWSLLEARRLIKDDHSLIWLDQASIDQLSDDMKALLVPKMTACYSLSYVTLVLDNSHLHPYGTPDNYFSRTWTFQEFCLPPFLIMYSSNDDAPDIKMREEIQRRFWSSSTVQEFKVVWSDDPMDIKDALLQRPEIVDQYFNVVDTRLGFYSTDRFAAIMQTISGVMCFTQDNIDVLKKLILSVIADVPERFQGYRLIDNTGWNSHLTGSANSARLLAGKPCPGDKLPHACLLLAVTDREVTTDQDQRQRSVSLTAFYNPIVGGTEAAPIPVMAVVDPSQNIIQQVSVAAMRTHSSVPINDNRCSNGSIQLSVTGEEMASLVMDNGSAGSNIVNCELDLE